MGHPPVFSMPAATSCPRAGAAPYRHTVDTKHNLPRDRGCHFDSYVPHVLFKQHEVLGGRGSGARFNRQPLEVRTHLLLALVSFYGSFVLFAFPPASFFGHYWHRCVSSDISLAFTFNKREMGLGRSRSTYICGSSSPSRHPSLSLYLFPGLPVFVTLLVICPCLCLFLSLSL